MLIINDNLLNDTVAAQSNTFSSWSQLNSESSLLPYIYRLHSLINSYKRLNRMKLNEKTVSMSLWWLLSLRERLILLDKL